MPQTIYSMDIRPGDCKGAVELTFRITFDEITGIKYRPDYEWTRVEIEMRKRPSDPGPVYLDVSECGSLQELLSVQYEQGNLFDKFDEAWQAGQIAARENA